MAVVTVRIVDPDRAAQWQALTGSDRVIVNSLSTHKALLGDSEADVYMIDLGAYDEATQANIVAHVATKFGTSVDEARDVIASVGLPLDAAGTEPPITLRGAMSM